MYSIGWTSDIPGSHFNVILCPNDPEHGTQVSFHMSDKRTPQIIIERRIPTPEEHRRLSERVGWIHAFHWPSMPRSLDASLAGVVVLDGDTTIGMGRVVGDGILYFYIQDVVVAPDYQGQGIGQRIVEALLDAIRRMAPAQAFVGLFATDAALPLYERSGFNRGDMTGMFQVLPPDES
jgi:GNAT superfamily N-acetyltransferase